MERRKPRLPGGRRWFQVRLLNPADIYRELSRRLALSGRKGLSGTKPPRPPRIEARPPSGGMPSLQPLSPRNTATHSSFRALLWNSTASSSSAVFTYHSLVSFMRSKHSSACCRYSYGVGMARSPRFIASLQTQWTQSVFRSERSEKIGGQLTTRKCLHGGKWIQWMKIRIAAAC